MVTDERIIGRVLKGHTQEYRELMLRHQASVFRLAYRVLGSREDAEDATQETFLRAYGRLETCRDRGKFWPWLRRITLNLCLDRMPKTAQCEYLDDLPDKEGSSGDPVEDEVLKQAEFEDIRKAVTGLPDAYRAVVVLRYQEELSHKEIAEALGETLPAVQVRLHRARKMLAERLEVIANETR